MWFPLLWTQLVASPIESCNNHREILKKFSDSFSRLIYVSHARSSEATSGGNWLSRDKDTTFCMCGANLRHYVDNPRWWTSRDEISINFTNETWLIRKLFWWRSTFTLKVRRSQLSVISISADLSRPVTRRSKFTSINPKKSLARRSFPKCENPSPSRSNHIFLLNGKLILYMFCSTGEFMMQFLEVGAVRRGAWVILNDFTFASRFIGNWIECWMWFMIALKVVVESFHAGMRKKF